MAVNVGNTLTRLLLAFACASVVIAAVVHESRPSAALALAAEIQPGASIGVFKQPGPEVALVGTAAFVIRFSDTWPVVDLGAVDSSIHPSWRAGEWHGRADATAGEDAGLMYHPARSAEGISEGT